MDKQAHFELSGDQRKFMPDTSAEAIRERAGLLAPTPEQAEAFWHEHEPHMLPSDNEPSARYRTESP